MYQSTAEEYLFADENADDISPVLKKEQNEGMIISEDEEIFEVPEPKAPKAKGRPKKNSKTSAKGSKRSTRKNVKTDEGESSDF